MRCSDCNGSGRTPCERNHAGWPIAWKPCRWCHGAGKRVVDPTNQKQTPEEGE